MVRSTRKLPNRHIVRAETRYRVCILHQELLFLLLSRAESQLPEFIITP